MRPDLLREVLADVARKHKASLAAISESRDESIDMFPLPHFPERIYTVISGILMSSMTPNGATVVAATTWRWRQSGPPDLEELWRDFNRRLVRHVRPKFRPAFGVGSGGGDGGTDSGIQFSPVWRWDRLIAAFGAVDLAGKRFYIRTPVSEVSSCSSDASEPPSRVCAGVFLT